MLVAPKLLSADSCSPLISREHRASWMVCLAPLLSPWLVMQQPPVTLRPPSPLRVCREVFPQGRNLLWPTGSEEGKTSASNILIPFVVRSYGNTIQKLRQAAAQHPQQTIHNILPESKNHFHASAHSKDF